MPNGGYPKAICFDWILSPSTITWNASSYRHTQEPEASLGLSTRSKACPDGPEIWFSLRLPSTGKRKPRANSSHGFHTGTSSVLIARFVQVRGLGSLCYHARERLGRLGAWNAPGNAEKGNLEAAGELFNEMRSRDIVSCVLDTRRTEHWRRLRTCSITENSMMTAYAQNSHVQGERSHRMSSRDLVSWNVIIAANLLDGLLETAKTVRSSTGETPGHPHSHAQSGYLGLAANLFEEMEMKDLMIVAFAQLKPVRLSTGCQRKKFPAGTQW